MIRPESDNIPEIVPMSPQQSIAHYKITSKLGEGGMGAVYRATDTKLGRDVAIKVLPDAFAADAARMARFEREAQVLASLNHPNIAAIYGIEAGALVMELVEGPDLSGPLPVDTVIDYARQIAAGLEAAHERGIIHRDLKPANIKVTPDGAIKLLDFGLAKATEQSAGTSAAASPTMSPTLSLAMTQAGMLLGTAAYMSPEQARGKPVDKRADIWAFGVVLFELLTGHALFGEGETVSDSLAAVITKEPDFASLPKDTPPDLVRLLRRCLRKDPKLRLRDIGEARIALDEPAAIPAAPAALSPARRSYVPWAVAAVAVVAAAAGWWRAMRPAEFRPVVRMNVEVTPDMQLINSTTGGMMALSPDGQRLVVTAHGADGKVRLYTRLLQQSRLTPLAGTENAGTPFFSPDGQSIGFAADGNLKKVSVEGGAAISVCPAANVRGASWGDDGNIVFAPHTDNGLSRVSSAGGTPVPLTKLKEGERTHRWPQVLPGSRAVLFTAHSGVNNYDEAAIEVYSLQTGQRKTVQRGGFFGRYAGLPDGSGRLLYIHQSTLFAAPFDLRRLEVTGPAIPVQEEVSSSGNGGGDFSFSRTGTLVYLSGTASAGTWTIAWVDSAGQRTTLHAVPGSYYTPRLSPDGKRLAFSMAAASGSDNDLWVMDLDHDTSSRLSFLKNANEYPVWTRDGKSIVFRSEDAASPGLYWIRADGGGEAQRLTDGKANEYPYSVSPDGKRLAFSAAGNGGNSAVYTAPIEGDAAHPKLGKPELFVDAAAQPAFSPDGRWLAICPPSRGTVPRPTFARSPGLGAGGRFPTATASTRSGRRPGASCCTRTRTIG